MWLPYHDPRACWGFAAGLRQRIAPRAYGPAIRLAAARPGYHAWRASHNLPTLAPRCHRLPGPMSQPAQAAHAISTGYARRMSQLNRRHVTDRLPIGSDGLGIDWREDGERFREVSERLGHHPSPNGPPAPLTMRPDHVARPAHGPPSQNRRTLDAHAIPQDQSGAEVRRGDLGQDHNDNPITATL